MDEKVAKQIIAIGAEHDVSPLKAIRHRLGISVNDLATKSGVDPELVANVEEKAGTAAPTLKHRQAIAAALGVDEKLLFHFGD